MLKQVWFGWGRAGWQMFWSAQDIKLVSDQIREAINKKKCSKFSHCLNRGGGSDRTGRMSEPAYVEKLPP